jgi:endoglucanase
MQRWRAIFFRASPLKLLGVLVVLLLVSAIALTIFLTRPHPQGTGQPEQPAAGGLLSVDGARLLDAQGRPVLLRGAQIASPFNFLSGWQAKNDPAQWLNPSTFQAMRSWHMNALRLPLSGWYYQEPRFLPMLDTVVEQANQAGLYVVLALFDNAKSGSPYGQGAALPKAENITFWKLMAAHFAHHPMVLFDLFNEPADLTAQNYLHGGGTVTGSTGKVATIVGFQPLVDAIRSVGARQIIIAPATIAAQHPNVRIQDPNVIYTAHVYSSIADYNPAIWDQDWGSLLGHYPLYYGEWAVLPNSLVPKQCDPYTPTNAAALTRAFLDYMQQRQISWTAWQFRPYYLVQDITSYTPTTFEGNWTPCDTQSHAGMGLVVKEYLAQHPVAIREASRYA